MSDLPSRHAVLAPSSADRWLTCLGSVALTKDLPDYTSEYAINGTDLHEVGALCLETHQDAAEWIGHAMLSGAILTEEDAEYLQRGYLDPVRAYAALGTLLVEESASLAWYTGNPKDQGTADIVVVGVGKELIVGDLKMGRGVEVSPDDNRQCKIYALSVIEKHGLEGEYDSVRIVIFQPRIGDGKPKEWVVPMAALLAFKEKVQAVAQTINMGGSLKLVPSEKACRFCKAKATCPALRGEVNAALAAGVPSADGFDDLTKCSVPMAQGDTLTRAEILGMAMDKVDLVDTWIKAVQSAVELDLLAGQPVVGKDGPYKLVQGKKGNRKWTDAKAIEDLFRKQFRMTIEEAFDLTLISPTTAEKRLKNEHPTRWGRVQEFITQSEGAKHVANFLDRRPAIEVEKPADGFVAVVDTPVDPASEFL